jgi:hypothetical protein
MYDAEMSLASAHRMSVAPPSYDNQKPLQTLPNVPAKWGGEDFITHTHTHTHTPQLRAIGFLLSKCGVLNEN